MEVNAVNTEDIGRLKRALEDSISTGEFERSNDILQMIKGFHMTYDLLKSCKIGRSVGVLRKHPNKSIARMASEIVTSWKILCGAKETSGFDSTEEKYASMTLNDFLTLDLPDSLSSIKLFDGSVSFNENRSRIIKPPQISEVGPVVYWMSRDQRVQDNWAMIRAQQIALQQNTPLAVVFCLSPQFLGAPIRHYGFMLRGLKWLHSKLSHLNISFFLLLGDPVSTLPHFCNKYDVKTLMCDFSPLKISRKWKSEVLAQLGPNVAVHEVDAHNIAPCWKVSNKCEFSAKTIRPKIHNAMDIFLTEFPEVISHPYNWNTASNNGSPEYRELVGDEMWESVIDFLHVDTTVPELTRFESGEHSAESAMYDFISRIDSYSDNRNDPAIRNGVSHLSPYIHFGQLSTQRIVLEIKRAKGFSTPRALFPPGERTTGAHSYCEELVVRKELSDNFCLYNSQYDSIEGAHA
jgi:deoxyribodipyrimidine photo-lyase